MYVFSVCISIVFGVLLSKLTKLSDTHGRGVQVFQEICTVIEFTL